MNKKFAAALVLVLWASSAFAAVTPEQALSDPRVGPFVENTKLNGAALLSGRYAHTQEIPQRSGGQKILAPTSLIIEVMSLNPEQNTYSVNADLYGHDLFPMYMALDFSGPVPILRTYAADEESEEYEVIAEEFAVVLTEGKKHLWCFGATDTGEISYWYPLNDDWFPESWYAGTWKTQSGTTYSFSDGQARMNGQDYGKLLVSDNRLVITRNDGSKEVLYAVKNPETGSLVVTSSTGQELVAEVLTRSEETPKAEKPKAPKFPPAKPKSKPVPPFTAPKTETQMPTEFPKMPKVNMPKPQTLNLDGVWGAYVNNQQWVLQYKGNQYFGWINGQPSEMGIFQLDGDTISGTNNNGVNFTAELELDDSGQSLTMTFPNGNSITYQRLQ